MTAVEAAACGRPVVGFSVGGLGEVVADGVTGLLAPPEDTATLARLLKQMEDPVRRMEYGEAARERWKSLFTPERMAQDTAEVYRDVVFS